jgi:hypothetical protein
MRDNGFMLNLPRRFFLQALDSDYGCSVLEAMFEVADLDGLRAILGLDAEDDPELSGNYSLEAGDLIKITKQYGVAFDPGDRIVQLVPWHSLRTVPYMVHTNFELFLLINGTKQFARELELYPPHRHFQEELFDRFVSEGVLHKEVFVVPFPAPIKLRDGCTYEGEREVCYTRKGQEWRIPAWRLIRAAFQKSRWNDDFERLEGMLFGYEEWQMDWWIAHIRENRANAAQKAAPNGVC